MGLCRSSNISSMKHWEEESWKYDTQRSIFDELQVFYLLTKHCIECLILFLKQNEEEEGGEIKDAKMSSF